MHTRYGSYTMFCYMAFSQSELLTAVHHVPWIYCSHTTRNKTRASANGCPLHSHPRICSTYVQVPDSDRNLLVVNG